MVWAHDVNSIVVAIVTPAVRGGPVSVVLFRALNLSCKCFLLDDVY